MALGTASTRPLRLRMRPDLQTSRSHYLGAEQVVVKDPVALKYYRFAEEEYALLQLLDGRSSLEQIRREFERTFRPQTITEREIHAFYCQAYRDALILSDAAGQGEQLHARHQERRRRAWHDALGNVLCIRFRGFDPDRFLGCLTRWAGWLFSPWAVAAFAVLAGGALLLLVAELAEVRARLPQFHEFFAARNWLWLATTLALTKILHELGHGVACKRFGGECHEMGLMLLVLTPCLYCNVSDAWTFPDKWRRVAVAAAGVYVEWILASVATFVWWFSEPGLVQHLCLSVMVVCSVGTLAFNANPLLRYDGYYVLADLLEIPNLRQRAWAVLGQAVAGRPPCGTSAREAVLPRRRCWLLAAYAVASVTYQVCLTLSVLWFLDRVFEPYGLKTLGQAIACLALYGLVIRPAWRGTKRWLAPDRPVGPRPRRLLIASGILSAVGLGVVFVPLPCYVRCGLTVTPADADRVYVEIPGTVVQLHVRPGDRVAAHDKLLTLENLDVELEVAKLSAERGRLAASVNGLRQQSLSGDAAAAAEIESTQEALASVNEQLERRRADLGRLTLTSPRSGIVWPVRPSDQRSVGWGPWPTSPLDRAHIGAHLPRGTAVCQVGRGQRFQAVLDLDESHWERIRVGQPAALFLDQAPTRAILTRIDEMAAASTLRSPHARNDAGASGRDDVPGEPDDAHPKALCRFQASELPPVLGGHGRARIFVGYQTLAQRIWRWGRT